MQASSYLNSQDTQLARALVSYDRPQRVVLSTTYELPVGPRKFLLNKGVVSKIVGGWETNFVFTKQSGVPTAFNASYYLTCDPKLPKNSVNEWFITDPSCWVQRPANTLRTMPLYRATSAPKPRRRWTPTSSATSTSTSATNSS